jgi:hypothetical protein
MRWKLWTTLGGGLVLVSFVMLPTERVSGTIPGTISSYEYYDNYGGTPKSGLRKAIEGRLKWLGFPL